MIVKSEIILCPKCKGTGAEEERSSAYDTKKVKCPYCSGNRVVVEKTVHENLTTTST